MTHRITALVSAVLTSFAGLCLPLLAWAATSGSQELANPLNSNFDSVPKFIAGALRLVVIVGLPIISLLIVYSGFLFVLARGNPGDITKAKNNFLYVILGSILLLGAWVIATLIGGTVTQLTNG